MVNKMKASELIHPQQTQLDRIENQNQMIIERLDKLLEKKKPKPRKRVTDNPLFDEFWEAYPLKKGKQAALRAYNNRHSIRQINPYQLINDVVLRTANDAQWLAGYIPHASTYLNGERWNDEMTPVVTKANTLPRDNGKLQPWAIDHGYRCAWSGETFTEYRQALEVLHNEG